MESSADRSSRWNIRLKIESSEELRGPGEHWFEEREGQKKKKTERKGSFFRPRRWKVGAGSFSRLRIPQTGGSSFFGAGKTKNPSSKINPIFEGIPPIFSLIFGPILGADGRRWEIICSSEPKREHWKWADLRVSTSEIEVEVFFEFRSRRSKMAGVLRRGKGFSKMGSVLRSWWNVFFEDGKLFYVRLRTTKNPPDLRFSQRRLWRRSASAPNCQFTRTKMITETMLRRPARQQSRMSS